MVNLKQNPPDLAETKEYFEVKLNGGRPNKGLHQYLNNDRKVLSFKILWEDRSYHGGSKVFTLNYYLADSQMEVKEQIVSNSGHDPFPMMLKKSKVPRVSLDQKLPSMTHYPGMSLKKEEYYTEQDLICGNRINVFGRDCLILECDEFTKQWYSAKLGIEQETLHRAGTTSKLQYNSVPEYNGIGNEEDTMGSVRCLQPKPPRKDENKIFK